MKLLELPYELFFEIFKFLKNEDRYSAQNTSKELRMALLLTFPRIYFGKHTKEDSGEYYYLPRNDETFRISRDEYLHLHGRRYTNKIDKGFTSSKQYMFKTNKLSKFDELNLIHPPFLWYDEYYKKALIVETEHETYDKFGRTIQKNNQQKMYIGDIKTVNASEKNITLEFHDGNIYKHVGNYVIDEHKSAYSSAIYKIIDDYLMMLYPCGGVKIMDCVPFSRFDPACVER